MALGRPSTAVAPEPTLAERRDGHRTVRFEPLRRRRMKPLIAAGVILAVVFGVGFAVATLSTDHRSSVLVVTRDVPAGTQLTGADLQSVKDSAGDGVATIPASQETAIIGQVAAVPLSAGSLLNPADVGTSAAWPPPGRALAGVALKPGTYPPQLDAGARVAVSLTNPNAANSSSSSSAATTVTGTVISVTPNTASANGGVLISLLLSQDAALAVDAASSGQVAVAELNGGGS
jgi:hypothetical protein